MKLLYCQAILAPLATKAFTPTTRLNGISTARSAEATTTAEVIRALTVAAAGAAITAGGPKGHAAGAAITAGGSKGHAGKACLDPA